MIINLTSSPSFGQNYKNSVTFGSKNPKLFEKKVNISKIKILQNPYDDKFAMVFPEKEEEFSAAKYILREIWIPLKRYIKLQNDKARKLADNASSEIIKRFESEINREAKMNPEPLKKLEDIKNLEKLYVDNKVITLGSLDSYADKVRKFNMNPDGKYTPEELLKFIESGKPPVKEQVAKKVSTPVVIVKSKPKNVPALSSRLKNEFIAKLEKQYEEALLKNLNVYYDADKQAPLTNQARMSVLDGNVGLFKKYPEIVTQDLIKIYGKIDQRVVEYVDKINKTDLYALGEHWEDMAVMETQLKYISNDIKGVKQALIENPDNKSTQTTYKTLLKAFKILKKNYESAVKKSIRYEGYNRRRVEKAGSLMEYKYLTDNNPVLNKHKELYALMKSNNGQLTEEQWAKIIK